MFGLEMRTSNAAFEDGNTAAEIARILREVAEQIEVDGLGVTAGSLRDINGNTVGRWPYAED